MSARELVQAVAPTNEDVLDFWRLALRQPRDAGTVATLDECSRRLAEENAPARERVVMCANCGAPDFFHEPNGACPHAGADPIDEDAAHREQRAAGVAK